MVSFKAVGYAIAVYLMTQQCQCPQIVIPLITDAALQTAAGVGSAGASFAGAIIQQNVSKRRGITFEERGDIKAPAGVPQQEFDRCSNDMSQEKVHVHVKGPVENNGKEQRLHFSLFETLRCYPTGKLTSSSCLL